MISGNNSMEMSAENSGVANTQGSTVNVPAYDGLLPTKRFLDDLEKCFDIQDITVQDKFKSAWLLKGQV